MAAYHLHVSSGSKSSGKGAGGKARYLLRSGPYATARERAQEGNTVRAAKIDKSAELVFAESGNMPSWAADEPLRFWDASDTYERANGSTYREVEIALPRELSIDQQIALAQAFAKEVATVEGGVTPWTLAVHQQDADHPEHRHVHILLSDRIMDGKDRTPETFFKRWNAKEAARGGARKAQERQEAKKKVGETWAAAKWTDRLRPLWESMANDALQHAGVEARIDHRTLDAQRIEMEQQAGHTRTPELAPAYRRLAEALDRPPEPKKGRVLTHAGPEQAPERAGLLIEYERAKAERQALLAARREAEREAAEIERKESILRKAQARQQERDPFDRMKIRGRWERRQKARQNRQRDAETAAEQRPGIRHPERPQWQVYRERMLTEAYNQDIAQTLGRWVRVERVEHGLHIHNRQMDLTDHGDRITAGVGGNDKEIATMLQLAQAKGWKQLALTGSQDFQERAGAEALAAGFDLADADLKARILGNQEKEAEAHRAKILEAAPVLAEWMRAHPNLAKSQRLAGGKLPFACPDGMDRSELQQTDLWTAADAWTAGRYGTTEQWQALSKGADPLQAKAADAGREEGLNASARRQITLRVGQDAPSPSNGLKLLRTGPVTRENVEAWAKQIKERQALAGVAAPIMATFGSKSKADDRVMVLEHLLRQGLELDAAALKEAGHEHNLNEAQRRLKTHEPDGSQQEWYTHHLEERRQKQQAAERARAMEAAREAARAMDEARAEAERKRAEAEKAKQEAERKLAEQQRRAYLEDFQSRVESLGYRETLNPDYLEARAHDLEYQRISQEVAADPSLRKIADEAYAKGSDRANQEREDQQKKSRKELLSAAKKLGRGTEAAGKDGTKLAEIQLKFADLVQRGEGLGVTEDDLAKAHQRGRKEYREEQDLKRGNGMRMGR